jgi:hypothetical protein
MEPASGIDFDKLAPEACSGLRILPVIHDRIDMASVVRLVVEELEPAGIAVELPTTLRETVLRAVRRLPKISLVISQPEGEEALVWTSAPGEPFAEALRWAWIRERPVFFIDPDIAYKERHSDAVPDPQVLWSLGPEKFLELLVRQGDRAFRSEKDHLREAGMAHHLKQARKETPAGSLLALIGAAHVRPVSGHLQGPTAQPFARVHRAQIELRHLHPESLTALLPDPPLAHAVFEVLREGEVSEDVDLVPALSRKIPLVRDGLRLIAGQKDELARERPFHVARYAARYAGRKAFGSTALPDRVALQGVVWRVAASSYEQQTQEEVKPWQRSLFFDYGRRYARVQGLLVPGLYEWVVAARGVGDDNLAWEVFDVARIFPWQKDKAEILTVRVDGNELDLGTRKINFRKRFFRVKQRPVRVPVRKRPTTDDPGKWLEAFDVSGLCSYRPEDFVIEDYAAFLQHKAVSILSVERKRTEPFTSSMLDGIDMRETLRNLHEDRIYVQELGRAPGEAGSVVVIFDRDLRGDRFPYCMTWLGEDDQESDMAFYSTSPAEQVVGPGIMRATYGGLMMTYPPRRMLDVWEDRDYRIAREKTEVLVMAGIDYSEKKLVVHVAEEPPSSLMTRYAAVQGKRLVHIPIGSLSPITVKKIRVVHLLAGRDKRAVAKDYIW